MEDVTWDIMMQNWCCIIGLFREWHWQQLVMQVSASMTLSPDLAYGNSVSVQLVSWRMPSANVPLHRRSCTHCDLLVGCIHWRTLRCVLVRMWQGISQFDPMLQCVGVPRIHTFWIVLVVLWTT